MRFFEEIKPIENVVVTPKYVKIIEYYLRGINNNKKDNIIRRR